MGYAQQDAHELLIALLDSWEQQLPTSSFGTSGETYSYMIGNGSTVDSAGTESLLGKRKFGDEVNSSDNSIVDRNTDHPNIIKHCFAGIIYNYTL